MPTLKLNGMWFPIGLCGLFVLLAAGVTVSGASAWGVATMWGMAAASVLATAIYAWHTASINPIKFTLNYPSVSVGWYDDRYKVIQYEVAAEVERVVSAMSSLYSRQAVITALNGCQVIFRESSWVSTGRTVAGLQYGFILEIGWQFPLKSSSLAHELGHRVLEICGGDPSEFDAHVMLSKLGL